MDENQAIYLLQILAIISFLVCVFLVSKIIFFYLVTIKKWEKCEAIIIECETKWFRSKRDADTEGWQEMIKYNYTVNSIEFENDCVTKNFRILGPDKDFATNYNFSQNEKIEITYDPTNPKNSIIDTKLSPLTVIFPIGFYLIVYLFLF